MEDDALAEDLRQAIGELVRAVRAADTMPSGEAAILGHLDRGGPQTTADLAHRRGVTHQSAAKSVKELLGAVWCAPNLIPATAASSCWTSPTPAALDSGKSARSAPLGWTPPSATRSAPMNSGGCATVCPC